MNANPRQQSGKFWLLSLVVPGVFIAVGLGASWMPGLVRSRSAPAEEPGATPPSVLRIRTLDNALGEKAMRAAAANWLVAQVEARRSATWEAWIGMGDAALRLGDAMGSRSEYIVRARRAYRKAMLTAFAQNSQRGVLAAAEAFAALGDQPLADDLRALAQKLPSPRG